MISKGPEGMNPTDSKAAKDKQGSKTKPRGGGPKPERGLPAEEDRLKLATVWLETQAKLWPDFVGTSALPHPTPENARILAESFRQVFLDKQVPVCVLPDGMQAQLGASYLRYSTAQQSKRSLDDQLFLQLKRAREDSVFIPWAWVFADAGVSGTTTSRTGYQLLKDLVRAGDAFKVAIVYIDELARATRNTIEALTFGQLIANHSKRLIGVSDGFDSASPQAKASLMFSAFLAEQFIDQQRYRVLRGIEGAQKRGSAVGHVPIGYRRVPFLDADGRQKTNGKGRPLTAFAIDDEWSWVVGHIDNRFVDDRWPARRIAKELNSMKAGGKTSWSTGAVTDLLRQPLYVGIRVHNRRRTVYDPITGTTKDRENHRREWRVQYYPHLQLRTRKRWREIKRRLAEVHAAHPGRKKGSAGVYYVYPKTLFSGALFCGKCGSPLQLYRSYGKNRQLHCRAGQEGRYGCTLKGSKSVPIIERALLDYVRARVLTRERIERLVEATNRYLAQEASKPRVDTSSMEQAIANKERQRQRCVQMLGSDDDPDLGYVKKEVKALSCEIRELKSQLNDIRAKNSTPPPAPVDLEQTLLLLDDLHGLVSGKPEAVGPILRELLGPITVIQVKKTDREKPFWVAQVGPDLVPLLARAARARGYPSSSAWLTSTLRTRIPRNLDTVVFAEDVPRYQHYAKQILELVKQGLSTEAAGKRLGLPPSTAYAAYRFAKDGTRYGEWANAARKRRRAA